MNAITYMIIAHPFASIWLALTFIAWIVIYASTLRKEETGQGRRKPVTSVRA